MATPSRVLPPPRGRPAAPVPAAPEAVDEARFLRLAEVPHAYKVGDRDGRLVELLLFAGAAYFVICFTVSRLVKHLQARFIK